MGETDETTVAPGEGSTEEDMQGAADNLPEPEGSPDSPAEPVAPTVAEQAMIAAAKSLDYRTTDENGDMVPIVPQPSDRQSWEQGARAGIEALIRLVPANDVAFEFSQLWLFVRAMAQQMNVLTTGYAAIKGDTSKLVAKLDEYAGVLPEPGSFAARAFRWGGNRGAGQAWRPAPSGVDGG